jgi:hypothetical protein
VREANFWGVYAVGGVIEDVKGERQIAAPTYD